MGPENAYNMKIKIEMYIIKYTSSLIVTMLFNPLSQNDIKICRFFSVICHFILIGPITILDEYTSICKKKNYTNLLTKNWIFSRY